MALLRDVKLSPARVKFLVERGHLFYTSLTQKTDLSPIERLATAVMKHGGVVFIVPEYGESDIDRLIARGEMFAGLNPLIVKGKPCRCHSNSAVYWSNHDDTVEIVTGYGLSDDGVWRQHTWCRKIKGGRIVETTEPRVVYFGVRLNNEEAESFFYAQSVPSSLP